jgi:multidrug efflux pump subunit AcrB
MLTGTLVTVAGFIPVAFNKSNAGEFTFTLFVVIAVSLVVSWVVAVLFTPLIGVTILPKTMKKHAEHKGWFAKAFSNLLQACLRWRWITIIATVLLFAASVAGLSLVQQQFFPSSDRPELIVDWNLPQNSSIAETSRQMAQFEREMLAGNPAVDHWSTYVGRGAPRFILSFDVQPADVAFGQTVIVTKGLDVRDKLKQDVESYLQKTFPGTDGYVKLLEVGPPVGKPIQYRVSGEDLQTVRGLAQKLASIVGSHPSLKNLAFDWNEPARVV